MTIVMNMSSYEIEREPVSAEYRNLISNAGWNPVIELISQQRYELANQRTNMPSSLASIDVDSFLQRMQN